MSLAASRLKSGITDEIVESGAVGAAIRNSFSVFALAHRCFELEPETRGGIPEHSRLVERRTP